MQAHSSPPPRQWVTDSKGKRISGVWFRVGKDGKRRYGITYRDTDGKQRWPTVDGGLKDAKQALRDKQTPLHHGVTVRPNTVLFRDVAARYLDSPDFALHAATTRTTYTATLAADKGLMRRFGHVKVGAIDGDMIGVFVRELEKRGLRRSSVENILKPMRGVFWKAVEEKLILVSPFAGLTKGKRPRKDAEPHVSHKWTDEEVERLLAASRARAQAVASRYDYSPILTVAAKAGLRLGECLGLDWQDVELTNGTGFLHVRQQWTRLKELAPPKAGSIGTVPIGDDLVAVLREHKLRTGRPRSGPVFRSRTGGRLSHRNVERRGFDKAAEDAGLENVTFHDLRHAYGSKLASEGLTAREIADVMRHKNIATTMGYIQTYNKPEAEQRVREAMSG